MIYRFNVNVKEIVALGNDKSIVDLFDMINKENILFVEECFLNESHVYDRYDFCFVAKYSTDKYKRNSFILKYGTFRSKNKRMIIETKDVIIKCELI